MNIRKRNELSPKQKIPAIALKEEEDSGTVKTTDAETN